MVLNNPEDIIEKLSYASLFGITKEEVIKNPEVMKYIELIALRREFETGISTTPEDIIAILLRYYDGYQYSDDETQKVINPYSFLCYLKDAADLKKKKITDAFSM